MMAKPRRRSSFQGAFRDTVLELGGNPKRILDRARLAQQDIEKRELLIRSNALVRLLNVAAVETGSDYFGMHLSTHLDLSFMGSLGLLLQHSRTVGDALKTFIRFYPVSFSLGGAELRIEGESAYLVSTNMIFNENMKQLFYFAGGIGLTILRALLGEDWRPVAIHTTLDRPELAEYVHRFLGVRLKTAQERDQIVFDASDLQRKVSVIGQFGEHLQVLSDEMEKKLEADIVSRTEYMIRTLMPDGTCSIENVSILLGLGKKTFQRRLQSQGVTFKVLVDNVRQSIARQHLDQDRYSMSQLAILLGYSEPSAFTRAFKRWFGMTPSQWHRRPST